MDQNVQRPSCFFRYEISNVFTLEMLLLPSVMYWFSRTCDTAALSEKKVCIKLVMHKAVVDMLVI